MTFTYDPATSRGRVRLLIGDTDSSAEVFDDDEIDTFLTLEGSAVLRAAAMALETMASMEAWISKRIKLGDLSTDGPAVSEALRNRASELRALADRADADDASFDWAEMVTTSATWEERLLKEALRE